MNHQQINGIDFHNFPFTTEIDGMLSWMGNNYLEYLATELTEQLKKQDALTEIIGIKCEADPEFETKTSELSQKVSAMKVSFKIQLLVVHSSGVHWRLHGTNNYIVIDIGTENAKISNEFAIEKSVKLD